LGEFDVERAVLLCGDDEEDCLLLTDPGDRLDFRNADEVLRFRIFA
jgi:hypothetical protein